jgi:large subunit ribosomal protein L10
VGPIELLGPLTIVAANLSIAWIGSREIIVNHGGKTEVKGQQKEKIVEELRDKFARNQVAILTRFSGLKVHEINQLRNEFKKISVDYRVVKNTLVRRAMEGTDIALLRDHVHGPLALALTQGDIVPVAKLLTDFVKDHPKLKIHVGLTLGKVLDAKAVGEAARLPTKEELLMKMMSVMNAPVVQVLIVVREVIAKLVRTLDAIQKQKANSV